MRATATVTTNLGTLRGAVDRAGVQSFKGIPYAAPPIGALRFMAPVPHPPWSRIRDALDYGSRAMQSLEGFRLAPQIREGLILLDGAEPIGEDCLTLNIWTPSATPGGKRPVMVWLHGGAFIVGSGASPITEGANLALHEDIVLVTLNHRLGLFGFLNAAEIGGDAFADSGNAGMLDIVMALEWVRDNISAFGGDPDNVTIFGQSGGGAKVAVLMAVPAAKGLFHRAIIQSGPVLEMMRAEDAANVAGQVMAQLGLRRTDIDALLTVPADRLLQAQIAVLASQGAKSYAERRRSGFNPIIDGRHLPAGPFEPSAPQISAGVPLMIGTNKDEIALYFIFSPWLDSPDEAEVISSVVKFLGDGALSLMAAYRRLNPKASLRDIVLAAASDLGIHGPSLLMADRKVAQNAAAVFVYLFAWESPILDGRLKACHGLETPFVFDHLERSRHTAERPGASSNLADVMRRTWARFARTGNPNHGGMPHWPHYDTRSRPTMIFDETCRVQDDPFADRRTCWRSEVLT